MTSILGENGEELAVVEVAGSLSDLTDLRIAAVLLGKGQLLNYYFGQGRRTVGVIAGDLRLTGRLETCWTSTGRLWRVRLAPVAQPA